MYLTIKHKVVSKVTYHCHKFKKRNWCNEHKHQSLLSQTLFAKILTSDSNRQDQHSRRKSTLLSPDLERSQANHTCERTNITREDTETDGPNLRLNFIVKCVFFEWNHKYWCLNQPQP